jgi:hypothetical protein
MKQILLILMLAIASMAHAQSNSAEVLTNAKIISMSKGGLPKAAILASIQNKGGNFDVSTDALIALKKQGVADEVITAMVNKGAKPEPVAVVKEVIKPFNQIKPDSKDCKLIDLQGPNKEKLKGIIVKSLLGNLTLYKLDGKLNGQFTPKNAFFLLGNTNNMIDLRLDSVRFLYADNSTVTLKVTGIGHTRNSNENLKPTFETVRFTFALAPGALRSHFEKAPPIKFTVFAEREGQFDDLFTAKQQAVFAANIICVENQ